MIGLASMLVPVAIGMLILVKLPRVAAWITKVFFLLIPVTISCIS